MSATTYPTERLIVFIAPVGTSNTEKGTRLLDEHATTEQYNSALAFYLRRAQPIGI